MRHANPRIYIGPKTNELILGLDRVHAASFASSGVNISLLVKRRQRGNWLEHEWIAYAVDAKGQAHFDIPIDFLTDAAKGFYDARMMMSDCEICELEIVKAPSIYIKCAETLNAPCDKTEWVEPIACDKEEKPCPCSCGGKKEIQCSCINPPGAKCVGCRNIYVTQFANINADYSGIRI